MEKSPGRCSSDTLGSEAEVEAAAQRETGQGQRVVSQTWRRTWAEQRSGGSRVDGRRKMRMAVSVAMYPAGQRSETPLGGKEWSTAACDGGGKEEKD